MVVLGQLAAARLVAAEQGVWAGANDEFVGWIVAAAGKDRTLHRGKDLALVTALLDQGKGRVESFVGEGGRLLGLLDLGRALEQAQAADDSGRVGNLAKGLEAVRRAAGR